MKSYHTIESLRLKALEAPLSVRGTFPRYMVNVDCETLRVTTPVALRRFLGVIYADAPHVYKNAGGGITIDFDLE